MYLIWASPIFAVIVAIVAFRVRPLLAGVIGAGLAIGVGAVVAPRHLGPGDLLQATAYAGWLTFLVGIVMVAGMFFRTVLEHLAPTPKQVETLRHRAFTACFLVGPFVEAGTGVGVGQVATVAMLATTQLPAHTIVLLTLFSQILVPWGAMANGTVIGAALSGLGPAQLGFYTAVVSVPLLLVWLLFFWAIAHRAGLRASAVEMLEEAAWVVATAALLAAANLYLGPEIAGMAALGPAIAARYLFAHRFQFTAGLVRLVVPYAALILAIALSRSAPIAHSLQQVSINPLDSPLPWQPFTHPASWLAAVGATCALCYARPRLVLEGLRGAWLKTWGAVATVGVYLLIASTMSLSGTIEALSGGAREALGPAAVLASPLLAGVFGFLTGSVNATNALLMSAQPVLAAAAGFSLHWVAAMHSAAAGAATMLSPVRVAFACSLAGARGQEREIYRRAWPLSAVPVAVLSLAMLGWYVLR